MVIPCCNFTLSDCKSSSSVCIVCKILLIFSYIKEECSTTECPQCVSTKEVCHVCKEKGFEHWCPALRRCDRCLEKDIQCARAVCLNITTDCQAIFKAALELLQKNQSDGIADSYSTLAPNPDTQERMCTGHIVTGSCSSRGRDSVS